MGAFLVIYPRYRIRTILLFFVFVRITFIPAALLIGFCFLTQIFSAGAVAHVQTGGWPTWHILAVSFLAPRQRVCLRIRIASPERRRYLLRGFLGVGSISVLRFPALCQLESGLYSFMASARTTVFGRRSF